VFQGESSRHDPEVPIRLATFDQYRSLLFSVAYRMLEASPHAEDMLQKPLSAGSKPRMRIFDRRGHSWLHHQPSVYQSSAVARVQREEYVGQWLPEPNRDRSRKRSPGIIRVDESLSMAFSRIAGASDAVERAVFLLREVFEYEYSEIAAVLGQGETNCRQILRRARQHVSAMRPRFKASARKQSDLL